MKNIWVGAPAKLPVVVSLVLNEVVMSTNLAKELSVYQQVLCLFLTSVEAAFFLVKCWLKHELSLSSTSVCTVSND